VSSSISRRDSRQHERVRDMMTPIRDVFCQYIESKRLFLSIAERCSIKGWPDRRAALQNSFRLQQLFNEREALRFDHLMNYHRFTVGDWKSLQTISARLEQGWSASEEEALRHVNSRYDDLEREILACQASQDPEALDEPLRAVQRDSEYVSARDAISRRTLELDKHLARIRHIGKDSGC